MLTFYADKTPTAWVLTVTCSILLASGCSGPVDPTPDAAVPQCGNGVLDGDEACDDGDANSDELADACRMDCTAARCGDGVEDTGEACDDGASNGQPVSNCTGTCTLRLASCGDGAVDPGELCDDGDANSNDAPDACREGCIPASCGDSVVDSGEDCDDGAGNGDEPNTCRVGCSAPSCGDGILDDETESCEGGVDAEGNPVDCVECGYCGDGIVGAGESCDEGEANSDEPGSTCLTSCQRIWRFVSVPDFLNADIGDVSSLTSTVNSTNADHEAAIAYVLDAIAAEDPDFVLVAGDMVNGHWIQDASGVQVFGPVSTDAERRSALNTAADLYYPQWLSRFEMRSLVTHTAVGDHEIGDNNWPAGSPRARAVQTAKAAFARHFTRLSDGTPRYENRPVGTQWEDTAYAFQHNNALFVTVDVFRQDDPEDAVSPEVSGEQLAWLDEVLTDASADPSIAHVFVQGHVPVLGPVRTQNTSNMSLPGRESSDFWRALVVHGVDAYLCGEVHHMTALNSSGVEQIAHGGIMGYAPNTNYLVATVYPDRIELELKWIDMIYEGSGRLWQAGSNRPHEHYRLNTEIGFRTAGTMVIDKSSGSPVFRDRTGFFRLYDDESPVDEEGLLVHYTFDALTGSTVPNEGVSGPINDLAMTGTPAMASGLLGNALTLSGTEFGNGGPTGITGRTPRTLSTWVRSSATAELETLCTLGTNMPGGKWDVDIDAENGGVVEIGIGGGRSNSAGTTSVTDGEWHHVVTMLPAGGDSLMDIRVFVDGEPITMTFGSDRGVDTRGGPLALGHAANSVGFQPLNATVDDLALWSRALTDAEVRAVYSFATSSLAHDAADVDALLAAFGRHEDVTIDGRAWSYVASGMTGTEGVLDDGATTLSIHLGGGAGFTASR